MSAEIELPGLDRLIEVCRKHELPLKLRPLSLSPPTAGELLLGMPCDPMLAAFYKRLGGATFLDLVIYPYGSGEHELIGINKDFRYGGDEIYCSSLMFGKEASLAYYYSAVPSLADAEGLQPIVYVDGHLDRLVLPIASNLDCFLDLYSRYFEILVEARPEGDFESGPTLPWSAPELVARDTCLVEGLVSGRYERWVTHTGGVNQWLSEVLAAAQRARR